MLANPAAGRGRHRGLLPGGRWTRLGARRARRCGCSTREHRRGGRGGLPRAVAEGVGRAGGGRRGRHRAPGAAGGRRHRRRLRGGAGRHRATTSRRRRAYRWIRSAAADRDRRGARATGRHRPFDLARMTGAGRRGALVRGGAGGRLRRDRQRARQPDALAARAAPLRPGDRAGDGPAAAARATRSSSTARTAASTAVLVAVGNCPSYGGGMRICPDADPPDGLLDVVVAAPLGAGHPGPAEAAAAPRHARHRPQGHRAIARGRCGSTADDIIGYADGERIGPLPLEVAACRVRSGCCSDPASDRRAAAERTVSRPSGGSMSIGSIGSSTVSTAALDRPRAEKAERGEAAAADRRRARRGGRRAGADPQRPATLGTLVDTYL